MLISGKVTDIQACTAVGVGVNLLLFPQRLACMEAVSYENIATLREDFLYLKNNNSLRGVQ